MEHRNEVRFNGFLPFDPKQPSSDRAPARCKVNIPNPKGKGFNGVTVVGWNGAKEAILGARKGDEVKVTGRLDENAWEDRDGNKRREIQVVADEFEVMTVRTEELEDDPDIPF